jgi:hypothetical protein
MKARTATAISILTFSLALSPTTLLTQPAFAQSHTPPTPAQIVANQVARLTTLLTLTTAQQAAATTIFTTEQTALSGLRTSSETARTALQNAVEANDGSAIATQSSQIGDLTGQQVLAQATANAAFYALLTSSQQTTYKALGGPGAGRGGPGGPGPGGFGPAGFGRGQ